jgi:hypothetical protein
MNTCPKFTGIPEDFTERVSLVYEGGTRNVKKKQGVQETTVPDSQAGLHRSRFALACSLFVACLSMSVPTISVIGLDQWCDF